MTTMTKKKVEVYNHPREYTDKVNAQFSKPMVPTYELAHFHEGTLDYDFENFIETTDFESLPEEVYYDSSLKKYPHSDESIKKSLEIDLTIWKSDFSDYINDYMKNVRGFDTWGAQLNIYPKGSISQNHIDYHGNFRIRRGLYDDLQPPMMYEVIKRLWVPLQDRKHGHYFEVNGHMLDWKAGDVWYFRTQYPHTAAVLGDDPRYFLILTGAKQEDIDAAKAAL